MRAGHSSGSGLVQCILEQIRFGHRDVVYASTSHRKELCSFHTTRAFPEKHGPHQAKMCLRGMRGQYKPRSVPARCPLPES